MSAEFTFNTFRFVAAENGWDLCLLQHSGCTVGRIFLPYGWYENDERFNSALFWIDQCRSNGWITAEALLQRAAKPLPCYEREGIDLALLRREFLRRCE